MIPRSVVKDTSQNCFYSMKLLEDAAAEVGYLKGKGMPVIINEIRDQKNAGFYLASPDIGVIVNQNVPLEDETYKKSIALLFKYLNNHLRDTFYGTQEQLDNALPQIEKTGTFQVQQVISRNYVESLSVRKNLLYDLGYNVALDFIVLDIGVDPESGAFRKAGTWDLYAGYREWNDAHQLVNEVCSFDAVVTYNGDGYDLPILRSFGPLSSHSIDLCTIIKRSTGWTNPGEIKLGNVALATSSVLKTVYGDRGWVKKHLRTDVVQDALVTKELFFTMLETSKISYISASHFQSRELVHVVDVSKALRDSIEQFMTEPVLTRIIPQMDVSLFFNPPQT